MIVKEIYLKNFISYSDAHVSFPLGVTVIVGENGAGKTALLDGITYALLKEHGRGRDENLINRGAGSANIRLKFSVRGKDIEVEWKLSRGRPAFGSLKLKGTDGDIPLVRPDSGEKTLLPEIMKLTGLDKRVFLNAIYVRQGEIARLLDVQPHERKEIIGQLLGIGELENIWKAMKEPIDALETERSILENRLRELPEKCKKLQEIRDRISNAENELEELRRKLKDVDQKIENVKNTLDELERKAKRFHELRINIAELEGEIKERRARLNDVDNQLRQLESARRAFQDFESCSSYYEEDERMKEELEKLREEGRDIEKKIKTLESKQSSIEVRKTRKQSLEESISQTLERFEKVTEFQPEPDKLLVLYQRIRQDLEIKSQELKRISGEKMNAKEKCRMLKVVSGIIGAMTTIFLVMLLLAIPIAPPLLSILPLIATIPVVVLLSRKEKKLESEISNIQEEMRETTEKMISLKGMEEDVKSIRDKLQEIEELDREIEDLEVEVQGLENLKERHDNIINSINSYEKRLEEIKEYVEKYLKADGVLNQVNVKTQVELEEKINRLNQDKSDLMGELEEYEGLFERAREELNLLRYDENEHSSKKNEYENLQDEKSKAEKEIAEIEGRIRGLKEQEESIKEEISELQSLQEKYERLNQYISSLERIRDEIFHKDALQRVIRRHAAALVEDNAGRFLQEFSNLKFCDISLDEDFNITIRGPAGEQTFEMLSGGEKIAIALILRLSIAASLVGEALECIIMDEPTIHLDSERRRELVNLLKNFKGGKRLIPQTIIVSHDRELEEAADRIYEVVRSEGTSKIRQLY